MYMQRTLLPTPRRRIFRHQSWKIKNEFLFSKAQPKNFVEIENFKRTCNKEHHEAQLLYYIQMLQVSYVHGYLLLPPQSRTNPTTNLDNYL